MTWTRGDEQGRLEGRALVEACEERGLDTSNPDGAFVAAVAAGTPATPDVDDALRAHVVTDACYRSAGAGGVPVTIEADRSVV